MSCAEPELLKAVGTICSSGSEWCRLISCIPLFPGNCSLQEFKAKHRPWEFSPILPFV